MSETVSQNMVSRIVDALYSHDYAGWSSSIDQSCETYTYSEADAKLTAIVVRPNPSNGSRRATNLFIQFLQTDTQYHISNIELDSEKISIIETDHRKVAIPIRGTAYA